MSRIVFRPWAVPQPRNDRATPHAFSVGWDATKDLLRAEVDKVCRRSLADDTLIVIEVDTEESSIRQDGFMRADRKVNADGVVVSFESKFGPLRYECNTFRGAGWKALQGWQANVRAIALALGDLRRVDRYGIGRRGEQYAGWKALGSGIAMPASSMTHDEAERILRQWMRPDEHPLGVSNWDVLFRRAAKELHPDTGGDATMFDHVKQARDLLTGVTT